MPDFDVVTLLCEMAKVREEGVARPAVSALYRIIIEGLCDDFTEDAVRICNQVLVKLLSFVRETPEGRETHELLNRFGVSTEEMLLDRYQRFCSTGGIAHVAGENIKKAVLLSRVTIGADIVILGTMIPRLQHSFPEAEIVLVGPSHLAEIFHAIPRVRCVELKYNRYGTLFDRMVVWPEVFHLVQKEKKGLQPGEFFVFDPDTRLTQLGLLPLVEEESTFYFCSRHIPATDEKISLSGLVNQWLNRLLGEDEKRYPLLSFHERHIHDARIFCRTLKKNCDFLLVINLGVGKNESKRVPDPFEEKLLLALLEIKHTLIILDSGASSEGRKRVERYLDAVRGKGFDTDFIHEKELATGRISFSHGVIGFRGAIGAIGSLINQADGFFGYDSCCQHLAASLKTPAVVAFAGAPNSRFMSRWRPPAAAGLLTLLPVADRESLDAKGIDDLVDKVVDAMKKIREKCN